MWNNGDDKESRGELPGLDHLTLRALEGNWFVINTVFQEEPEVIWNVVNCPLYIAWTYTKNLENIKF